MAEFKAFEPGVEVIGAAILATIIGIESDLNDLMDMHGLANPQPNAWYPQQAWLNVLREIGEERGGLLGLVSIGMRIPDNAMWPPDVTSIESALHSINVAYHMNHRGGQIGDYIAEAMSEGHVRMVCSNPYPSDFDYGLIYRTTQKFAPTGEYFLVERAAAPTRINGDAKCVYDVRWGAGLAS